MSVLDGLRKSADLVPTGAGWYNAALDDVREALTSDETVRSVVVDPAVNEALRRYVNGRDNQWNLIRAALAAAVGGDE